MARFDRSAMWLEPFKNFRFRIKMSGRYVAVVSKVTILKREHARSGRGDTREAMRQSLPRPLVDGALVVERGIICDAGFERWAYAAPDGDIRREGVGSQRLRRTLTIELANAVGHTAFVRGATGCWVSEYQALPDTDAYAIGIAFEHMTIEYDGIDDERAGSVAI